MKGIKYLTLRNWLNDEKHGKGAYIWKSTNEKYEGEFEHDTIKGKGKKEFRNGDYYEGEFEESIFNGIGKYYFAQSNNTLEGLWIKGDIKEGKLTSSNGIVYGKITE